MVAELTSAWTMAGYRIAIARLKESEDDPPGRKPLRLIIVVTDPEQLPASAKGLPVLTRAKNISDVTEGFIADLAGLLTGIAEETGLERNLEPERLFDAKEYRAAVISAMTLLEARLREKLNKVPWPQTSRPLSMRSLVDQGIERGIVPRALKAKSRCLYSCAKRSGTFGHRHFQGPSQRDCRDNLGNNRGHGKPRLEAELKTSDFDPNSIKYIIVLNTGD